MKIIKRNKSLNMCQYCHIALVKICNSIVMKNCVYFTVVLFMFTMCFLLNSKIKEYQDVVEERFVKFPTDLKYILFWEKERNIVSGYYYNYRPKLRSGQNLFINQRCKFINCFITYNENLLNGNTRNFDAVVFNIKEIYNVKKKNLKLSRSPKQIYIFHSMDSAELFPICLPVYTSFFNLTWTYRLNSDIPNPFFNIYDSNNTLIGPKEHIDWIVDMKHTNEYQNRIRTKTKAVAWIVNKCRSIAKHHNIIMTLVEELGRYNYSLDIYGHCGATKCPNNDTLECYKMIERDYFFQLVLEDSVDTDHLSDRMGLAMMHLIIPIVYGDMDYSRFLAPGSFINIQNSTIKEFGGIIDYLIKNPHKYDYLFDWKNHYYYTIRPRDYVCDLCEYLNQNISNHKNVVENNVRYWWNPLYPIKCHEKRMYDLFIDNN